MPDPRRKLVRRLLSAFGFLLTVVTVGALGYYQIGDGRWSLSDCFYMTVITLSTVGYGEVLEGLHDVQGARAFTTLLIIMGSGTLVYFVSMLTAFIVEGDLMGVIRISRMQKRIDQLEGHIVVCGAGSTGVHILQELAEIHDAFVVIDLDEERLRRLDEEFANLALLYVVGDATDDHVLQSAGIERARGLIAALHDDKDNLFVTISARALSPAVRIVAKAIELSAEPKLKRAGADTVVSPYRIGALRMVSEMIRPQVTKFLDEMLRNKEQALRMEELLIPEGSSLVGVKLRDTTIRDETDALVIALRQPDGSFLYNPPSTARLEAGMTLVLLAKTGDVKRLRQRLAEGTLGSRAVP